MSSFGPRPTRGVTPPGFGIKKAGTRSLNNTATLKKADGEGAGAAAESEDTNNAASGKQELNRTRERKWSTGLGVPPQPPSSTRAPKQKWWPFKIFPLEKVMQHVPILAGEWCGFGRTGDDVPYLQVLTIEPMDDTTCQWTSNLYELDANADEPLNVEASWSEWKERARGKTKLDWETGCLKFIDVGGGRSQYSQSQYSLFSYIEASFVHPSSMVEIAAGEALAKPGKTSLSSISESETEEGAKDAVANKKEEDGEKDDGASAGGAEGEGSVVVEDDVVKKTAQIEKEHFFMMVSEGQQIMYGPACQSKKVQRLERHIQIQKNKTGKVSMKLASAVQRYNESGMSRLLESELTRM